SVSSGTNCRYLSSISLPVDHAPRRQNAKEVLKYNTVPKQYKPPKPQLPETFYPKQPQIYIKSRMTGNDDTDIEDVFKKSMSESTLNELSDLDDDSVEIQIPPSRSSLPTPFNHLVNLLKTTGTPYAEE